MISPELWLVLAQSKTRTVPACMPALTPTHLALDLPYLLPPLLILCHLTLNRWWCGLCVLVCIGYTLKLFDEIEVVVR